jgi:hypothetical protein
VFLCRLNKVRCVKCLEQSKSMCVIGVLDTAGQRGEEGEGVTACECRSMCGGEMGVKES